jgi:tRNA (guanine10-N2)-methyltransferase
MEDIKQFSQAYPDKWAKALAPETSFKFTMDSFGRSPPQKEQVETFEKFAWIDFQGPVQMKNADATFFISENIGRYDREALPKWIYFGRYISDTNRDIIDKFTLKKRLYLSTTSMESEISFLTASQALIKSGSLVFDPFVGSGSLLVSAAAFGAYVIGGDIDMKVLKGKEPGKNIEGNFAQYKISDHLGGLVRFDSGHGNCLRFDKLLDAIVCDRMCSSDQHQMLFCGNIVKC